MPASKVGEGEFAQWLYHTRWKLDFNQDELALALGKSQAEVSRWETGKDLPVADDVVRVARVLDSDPFDVNQLVMADTINGHEREGGDSSDHSKWNVRPLPCLRQADPRPPTRAHGEVAVAA